METMSNAGQVATGFYQHCEHCGAGPGVPCSMASSPHERHKNCGMACEWFANRVQFAKLRKFTRAASYSVTIGWLYLERHIERQQNESDAAVLNLDPDFQRAHVWTTQKQAAYVLYILRNGTGARDLYFNCAGWMKDWRGPYVCVDGKQRLEAVRKFLKNQLPIAVPEFGGTFKFDDFRDGIRTMHCYFNWQVNDLETRAEVLQWYLDMNSGGVVHTSTELARVRALLDAEKPK